MPEGSADRAGFALWFPTIHGGDAAGRLAHADSAQLGYQLPLPQLFVVAGKAAHDAPLLVRLLFWGCGAALAAGGAAVVRSSLLHREGASGGG